MSKRRNTFSVCQHVSRILVIGLFWASACVAEATRADPNEAAQERLSGSIDANSGFVETGRANTASRISDPNYLVAGDSNLSIPPSSGASDGGLQGSKLYQVWEKIRRLPIWTSNRMVAFFIAIGLGVLCLIAWFFLSMTLRTRRRMHRELTRDNDIDEFLIVFSWTEKVLYFPSIIASLLAAATMYSVQAGLFSLEPEIVGRIWFPIVFLNFLVEEYNVRLRGIIATVVGVAFLLIWLHLASYLGAFLRLFTHMTIIINGTGFLLIGLIGFTAIVVSWIRGLFYYVTITPNYMDLQEGPSESGEQIGREDYNTRVNTSNFLERLLGFGKIEITFKSGRRHPIGLLVWGIGKKAQKLEKVRAKFVIDQKQRPRIVVGDALAPGKT